jgi:hypothetical protein
MPIAIAIALCQTTVTSLEEEVASATGRDSAPLSAHITATSRTREARRNQESDPGSPSRAKGSQAIEDNEVLDGAEHLDEWQLTGAQKERSSMATTLALPSTTVLENTARWLSLEIWKRELSERTAHRVASRARSRLSGYVSSVERDPDIDAGFIEALAAGMGDLVEAAVWEEIRKSGSDERGIRD